MSDASASGTQVESHVKVKLMIATKRNQVIFAECDSDFVDILFSFLTLPLGTFTQLINGYSEHIGCINGIRKAVKDLESRQFQTDFCKEMLINPRNSADLKNPNEAVKLYKCGACTCSNIFSTFKDARCRNGHQMDILALGGDVPKNDRSQKGVVGGVNDGMFVKGGTTKFMITDDLQVMPASTASYIFLLNKFGINDGNEAVKRTVRINKREVACLLKFSMICKCPFSRIFLRNKSAKPVEAEQIRSSQNNTNASTDSDPIRFKLLVSKTQRRVLYAEAGEDLVNFLFSFLTFPLGSIVNLLSGNSGLWYLDNLYRSVEDLSNANYIKSEECKKMLVSPRVAPFFSYENQLLQIEEDSYPKYFYSYDNNGDFNLRLATDAADVASSDGRSGFATIMDPKSPSGETNEGNGFMKGPALFMIKDDLTVSMLSPSKCLEILSSMSVTVNDVEERMVFMGKVEALMLLKSALRSKTVLTDVFYQRKLYKADKSQETCKRLKMIL